MPVSSTYRIEAEWDGAATTLGTADRVYRFRFPEGATQVAVQVTRSTGASADPATFVTLWPDFQGEGGEAPPDPSARGVRVNLGDTWHTIPLRRIGRGELRLGVSVASADYTSPGPVVRMVPERDPVVAALAELGELLERGAR